MIDTCVSVGDRCKSRRDGHEYRVREIVGGVVYLINHNHTIGWFGELPYFLHDYEIVERAGDVSVVAH